MHGCGCNDRDAATIQSVNAVEIVNGDLAEGLMSGWSFWAAMLNQGHHLTAIGGNDEHTPDETADQRIGRPTTVVYAKSFSERAIVEGIQAGRVYVRTRSAQGPTLELWAEAAGMRVMPGQHTRRGRFTLTATIGRADGQRLGWIKNGS